MKKKLYQSRAVDELKGIELVMQRQDIGELFLDLKNLTNNPLNDLYVEFTINTIIRNNFKTGLYIGKTNGYEALSFSNKTKVNFDILAKDLDNISYLNLIKTNKNIKNKLNIIEKIFFEKQYNIIIFNDYINDLRNLYGEYFKNLQKNGLILIYDVNRNKKMKKNLINHLKLVGGFFEEIKILNGIFLITKK